MMDRPETIRLMRMAHDEVLLLRRRVAELEPKAHAYDTLAIVARMPQSEGQRGFGEDIVWKLEQAVEELVAERNAEEAARDRS